MPTLREIREENYISRKTLAGLSGVAESTITRIEEGASRTTEEVANKLVAALNKKLNLELTVSDIEGLELYNVMRDRRNRTKERIRQKEQEQRGAA
jgi:transcriptional regulator with XRE-family HTH domain